MKIQFKYLSLIIIILAVQGNTYVIDPPKNAVWHNEQGLFYMQEGYYYQAACEYRLAISLSSNTAATATFYNNLGIVYQRAQKDKWALECFQKAIQMNPNFLEYYQNMIKVYKTKSMLTTLINKYSKIAKKSNANSKTWLVLGLAYLEMHKYDEAVICLNKFKKLEPNLLLTEGVDKILDQFNR